MSIFVLAIIIDAFYPRAVRIDFLEIVAHASAEKSKIKLRPHLNLNPLPPSDAVRKQKKKLEDLFSLVFLQIKNFTPLET